MDASRIALIVAAGFFVAYLALQVRPLLSPKRRAILAEVKTARRQAAEATTDEQRALSLVAAGEAAVRAQRYTSAAGLFLRALRVDPSSAQVVERVSMSLRSRPRLLRSLLERRLAALTAADARGDAYVAMLRALAAVYRASGRLKGLAPVLDRLAQHEQRAL